MSVRCTFTISGGGGVNIITNEIPSGTINSINTEFILANTPATGTVEVYLNGLIQVPGTGNDYTISGTGISFIKAPRIGSDILVSYAIDV